MAEFYDIYPKDRWKDPSYRLMDKFSLKGKKGFVTGRAAEALAGTSRQLGRKRVRTSRWWTFPPRRNASSRCARRCPSATA